MRRMLLLLLPAAAVCQSVGSRLMTDKGLPAKIVGAVL
jgi:hypothetical protein